MVGYATAPPAPMWRGRPEAVANPPYVTGALRQRSLPTGSRRCNMAVHLDRWHFPPITRELAYAHALLLPETVRGRRQQRLRAEGLCVPEAGGRAVHA